MSPTLRSLPVLALLAVCNFPGVAQLFTSSHFRIEQMAPGVFAAITTDQGYACANAGIVDLGGKTVIFDTFVSPNAARDLLRAAEHLTHNPVTYVVNSHFHNDHVRGNQVFPSNVDIISTVKTQEAIRHVEPEQIKWEIQNIPQLLINAQEALADENDYDKRRDLILQVAYFKAVTESHSQLTTRPPNITFEKKLTLEGTIRKVELLQVGEGHTPGDCIMLLPNEHIAFVGDLVSVGMHPYLPDGSTEAWKTTLQQMETLPIGTVVPGHGNVGYRIDINIMLDYIEGLEKLASNMIALRKNDVDFMEEGIPSQYKGWLQTQNFTQNLQYLYARADRDAGVK